MNADVDIINYGIGNIDRLKMRAKLNKSKVILNPTEQKFKKNYLQDWIF